MISAFLLILCAAGYRIAFVLLGGSGNEWLPNFAPIAAIALCGAFYLPRRFSLAVPLGALFLSDLILNMHYGVSLMSWEILPRYAVLGLIAGMGFWLANRKMTAGLFGASLVGSAIFHLATNTVSWLTSAGYAKTFGGWVQSWTIGLPEFQPAAWVFFRNTAVSDLIFTGLFVACMSLAARKSSRVSTEALATHS
jgi:hypothetical protein